MLGFPIGFCSNLQIAYGDGDCISVYTVLQLHYALHMYILLKMNLCVSIIRKWLVMPNIGII